MPHAIRQSSGATVFVPTAEEEAQSANLVAIKEERKKIEETRKAIEQELEEIKQIKQSLLDK